MVTIPDLSSFFTSRSNWQLFAVVLLSILTISVNNVIVQTYNSFHELISLESRLIIFIISLVSYSICQFFILKYVESETKTLFQSKSILKKIHYGVKIIQLFFMAEALFVIIQILDTSKYNLIPLVISTLVSYSTASLLMVMLSYKLFRWISRNRNKVVLLYAISALLLAFNIVSSLVYGSISILNQARSLDLNGFYLGDYPGNMARHTIYNIEVKYAYLISSVASFAANWFAAGLLLRNYSTGIPTGLFWFLMSTPMFYFISQYTPFFIVIIGNIFTGPGEIFLAYTVAYTVGESLGGILIGISFWMTGKAINDTRIRNYMYYCAIGYVLLFSSNYAINASNPTYPPFGFVSTIYVSFSTYLVFVGIYSAVLSMAHNNELRNFVRKSIKQEAMFGTFGTSEKFLEIERNVLKATQELKGELENQTGIEPTMVDADIKIYLRSVLSEISRGKSKGTS